jgi:hypothetical protein
MFDIHAIFEMCVTIAFELQFFFLSHTIYSFYIMMLNVIRAGTMLHWHCITIFTTKLSVAYVMLGFIFFEPGTPPPPTPTQTGLHRLMSTKQLHHSETQNN